MLAYRLRASCANLASSSASDVSSAGASTLGAVAFFWPLSVRFLNIAFYDLLWRGGFLTSSAFYDALRCCVSLQYLETRPRAIAAVVSEAVKTGEA